jgi:3-hydroxyisobutyrate dehydrogenase-like beta-hydroxyacid dehydrogenase
MGKTIAMLHPGEMGSGVAARLVDAGHKVVWVAAGRSDATRARAKAAGLIEADSLAAALAQAEIVFSICPPHAVQDVAREVAALGFKGVYVDANAVSPKTVKAVGSIVTAAGATWVDGGIVGSPPGPGISSRLYLSGPGAADIAALFTGTHLGTVVLDGPLGAASALKMCYAAWTKGTTALFADIRTLAKAEGVEEALVSEWKISKPTAVKDSEAITKAARKAWRWIAEMEEIAASFEHQGLPGHFHHGAAEIYRRLAEFKDTKTEPAMDKVADMLIKGGKSA